MKILPGCENSPGVSYTERKSLLLGEKVARRAGCGAGCSNGVAEAPLCRVVPRTANRNKHDCRWQSYRYYAVTATPMTEGVYASEFL